MDGKEDKFVPGVTNLKGPSDVEHDDARPQRTIYCDKCRNPLSNGGSIESYNGKRVHTKCLNNTEKQS